MKKWTVGILLIVVVACVSCGNCTNETDNRIVDIIMVDELQEQETEAADVDDEGYKGVPEIVEEPSAQEILPQYQKLLDVNNDTVGVIYLPDGNIQPIMQRLSDQNFYVDHNFFSEEDSEGSIFANSFTDLGQTGVSLLYGHTLKSGRMFRCLQGYLDADYLEEHQVMRIDTLYAEMEYEVVAVALTSLHEDFRYYTYVGDLTEAEFEEWKAGFSEYCVSGSLDGLSYGDVVCELSCCSYHVKDGRLVVVLKYKG